MAKIAHNTKTHTCRIDRFLGLHQSEAGDIGHQSGEAVEMENFRLTREGKLELRPGTRRPDWAGEIGQVYDLWSGTWKGQETCVLAYAGSEQILLAILPEEGEALQPVPLCPQGQTETIHLQVFQEVLYILTGAGYYCWQGDPAQPPRPVEGYVPLVVSEASPAGGGTELEGLNLLSDSYRILYSADGSSSRYWLPELENVQVEWVRLKGRTLVPDQEEDSLWALYGWGFSAAENRLLFRNPPPKGVDNVEVQVRWSPSKTLQKLTTVSKFFATDGSGTVPGMTVTNTVTSDGSPHTVTLTDAGALPDSTGEGYSWWLEWEDEAFAGWAVTDGAFRSSLAQTPVYCCGDVVVSHTEPDSGQTSFTGMTCAVSYCDGRVHLELPGPFPKAITDCGEREYMLYLRYRVGTLSPAEEGRGLVESMTRSALFNGSTDGRLWLYGDGTNRVLYSGLDENGRPRGDYFPQLNQALVGSSAAPVTGLVRQGSALMAFTPTEAYRITYSPQTLDQGQVIAGFAIQPVHSTIGCSAIGSRCCAKTNPAPCAGASPTSGSPSPPTGWSVWSSGTPCGSPTGFSPA